jgi:hypothetical protein
MPAPGDVVLLTNNGTKNLIISQSTANIFPESMTIWSLTVASPPGTTNTLLMDHSGTEVPLVLAQLTMFTNTFLTVVGSRLELNDGTSGGCSVGGTINEGGEAFISAGTLRFGDNGPASFNLTNGTLSVAEEKVGENYPAVFQQFGGVNTVTNLQLFNAQYLMTGGQVFGSTRETLGTSAGAIASFLQTGGTNACEALSIQASQSGSGGSSYTLSNGVLTASSTTVANKCNLVVAGGVAAINGPLTVVGSLAMGTVSANWTINGGTISAADVTADYALITQNGGTNVISGTLKMGQFSFAPRYFLNAGFLQTGSIFIEGGSSFLRQSGGVCIVTNTLDVTSTNGTGITQGYFLQGGELRARDILIQQCTFNSFRWLAGSNRETDTGNRNVALQHRTHRPGPVAVRQSGRDERNCGIRDGAL